MGLLFRECFYRIAPLPLILCVWEKAKMWHVTFLGVTFFVAYLLYFHYSNGEQTLFWSNFSVCCRDYFLVQRLHICAAQTLKCAVTCAVQIFKDFCAVTCAAQTLIFLYWRKERKLTLLTVYMKNSCKIYLWSYHYLMHDVIIITPLSPFEITKKLWNMFAYLILDNITLFRENPWK